MRRDDDPLLDTALRALGPGPPAGFTDAVMRRVAASPQGAAARQALWDPAFDEPAIPWWTRAFLQPATLGAFVVASLLAGWPMQLVRASKSAAAKIALHMTEGSFDIPTWGSMLAVSVVGSLLLSLFSMRAAELFFAPPSSAGAPERR